jgi:hypothetical protein
LAAAIAAHLAVFALITLTVKAPMMDAMGSAVPVNLVASAPFTDSRAATAAPQTQAAAVESPVPAAPPPRPVAAPAPVPTPAAAAIVPAPAKASQHPATPSAAAKPATPSFSLDALKASIAKTARASSRRPAFAPRGPARAETAPQARVDAGQGVSQSDLQGLQGLLERLWNTNCAVEGADAVTVPVKFTIDDAGRVTGRATGGGEERSPDPVVFAAARRAIDAVHEAEPYAAAYRGKSFTVIFDAKKACARQ